MFTSFIKLNCWISNNIHNKFIYGLFGVIYGTYHYANYKFTYNKLKELDQIIKSKNEIDKLLRI